VASDACFNINRATTRGTIADLNVRPPGIRDPEGSFEKTEVVDPAMNNGQNGAVSAVVISFTRPIVLGQSSANVVCLLTGAIDASSLVNPGDMTAPCGIQVIPNSEEGLKGSGEPVKTAITVGGDTFVPNRCDASIKIVAASVVSPREFRRGNANDDNKIDVADPVFTLNALLRDGPEIACDDAADANDDGLVDVSDAVFSANYLFLNGPVPPAPGPSSCGADPTADSVSCAGSAVCP
jgi:hypothetical protein